MVAVKPPSHKRAESRLYYRNIAICGVLPIALVYVLYNVVHLDRLSVETADAAIRQIERKAEDSIRSIGIPIPDYEQIQDETDQAIAYVQSFKSLDRSLNFFHIPKTAGTAIEDAAGAHKIPWGSCLFRHKPKRDVCPYPKDTKDWPTHVGYWHLPRFLFPACDVDPYRYSETFAVVREPYDRMVSEFYYICTLKVFDWRPDQCKREKLHKSKYMNYWLRQKIQQNAAAAREQSKKKKGVTGSHPALQYLSDNGHFTPQYDFIVGPNEVRYVDFVLQLETLADGFAELMSAFGLDQLTLKKMNALGAASRDEAQLTTQNLSAATIQLMHERFANDFLFGYPKRSVKVDVKHATGTDEEDEDEAEEEETDEESEEDEEEESDEEDEAEDDAVEEDETEGDDQASSKNDGDATAKKNHKQRLGKKGDDDNSA